jgi:hypothetical protein
MYVCIYMYTQRYICIESCVSLSIYVCMYVCDLKFMYVFKIQVFLSALQWVRSQRLPWVHLYMLWGCFQ